MIFQGPKGYIAQMCEVRLQYGNSTTKWPFYTFSSKFHSDLFYSLCLKFLHFLTFLELIRTVISSSLFYNKDTEEFFV